MRFIKILFLIIILVIVVLFFMQNTDALNENIYLSFGLPGANTFDADSLSWNLPTLPLYAIILIAFVIGALVTLLATLMTRIRLGGELRRANRKAKALEQEVNSLRKLPLQKNGQSGGGQQGQNQGAGQSGGQQGQQGQQNQQGQQGAGQSGGQQS